MEMELVNVCMVVAAEESYLKWKSIKTPNDDCKKASYKWGENVKWRYKIERNERESCVRKLQNFYTVICQLRPVVEEEEEEEQRLRFH